MTYPPLDKERCNYFFQVVAQRYEQGSLSSSHPTSPFPQGSCKDTDWGTAPAILDRLLHHSTVFNLRGQSYRLKEKQDSVLKQEVAMIQS